METIVAPKDNSEILTVAEILNRTQVPETPKLVVDSEIIELSVELAQVLKLVANELAQGRSISINTHDPKLTTQDAANFLDISRPTLIKYLDEFKIPVELVGRHRRISMGDLLALQDFLRKRTRDALAAMRTAAALDGEYSSDNFENPLIR
jgi:excisionase family DNA binding protein